MAELDVDALIRRFQDRAEAVKERGLPPVAGEERQLFIKQAEMDFMDFSLIAAADWEADDRHLILRIPLKPAD